MELCKHKASPQSVSSKCEGRGPIQSTVKKYTKQSSLQREENDGEASAGHTTLQGKTPILSTYRGHTCEGVVGVVGCVGVCGGVILARCVG